ncbi:MAG: hypothetical protein AABZ39_08970 [Spirochaetota bacterium]
MRRHFIGMAIAVVSALSSPALYSQDSTAQAMGKSSHGLIFGLISQNALGFSLGYNWRDLLVKSADPIGINRGVIVEYSGKGLYGRPYLSFFAGSVGPTFGISTPIGTDMQKFILRLAPEAGLSIGGLLTFYYAMNFNVLQSFTLGHEFGLRLYVIHFG